mgnify:FL=1
MVSANSQESVQVPEMHESILGQTKKGTGEKDEIASKGSADADRLRRRYGRLLINGLCTICGKNKWADGVKFCRTCRKKRLEYQHKQQNLRATRNKCTRCGIRKPNGGSPHCKRCLKMQNVRNKKRYKEMRQRVLNHYGNCCNCPKCDETNPAFLTIDHTNNNGAGSYSETT